MKAPSTAWDERTRNLAVATIGALFVVGGLLFLLFIPSHGWTTVGSACIPVGCGFRAFVRVCASTMRRERFDSKDVFGFAVGALAMLSASIGGFAIIYRQLGLTGAEGVTRDSWTCLYFSVITWTTVGYGDFAPSPYARPFAAVEAMIGYIFMALLTAAAVQIITKYQPRPRTLTVSGEALIRRMP